MILDGDSLVIVGGTKSFGSGLTDGIILKYHIDGTFGWVKYAGMEREDYFTSIVRNLGNEYYIGGTRNYYFDQTGWLGDFWIYNITIDGNTLLADTCMACASHEVEIAHDLVVDPGDNCFFSGQTKSFGYAAIDGYTDAYLGKVLNNFYWNPYVNNFGEEGDDVLYAIDYCFDHGVVSVGSTKFFSTGGNNVMIVKVDEFNTGGTIDLFAELTYDSITLSFENLKTVELNLYPNPVIDYLMISNNEQVEELIITSLSGQVVYKTEEASSKIDLSNLSSGIYAVAVKVDGQYYSTLLSKQ
ncbi:MAG: T9SS type A sorting domain-containing protein [Crocinitomicaceae bacterium]